MRIIYGDDAPLLLDEVCTYLRLKGHEIVPLETKNLLDFQARLMCMLEDGFNPDVLILGGHNILIDAEGEPIMDLDGFSLYCWLEEKQGLLKNCRLILLSRDQELRKLAQEHPEWGFRNIVAKEEPTYLPDLLEALRV